MVPASAHRMTTRTSTGLPTGVQLAVIVVVADDLLLGFDASWP